VLAIASTLLITRDPKTISENYHGEREGHVNCCGRNVEQMNVDKQIVIYLPL
jgi:hypothetical protein